jgi:acetyltransferase-like isoleucine patch superfamily enzyme
MNKKINYIFKRTYQEFLIWIFIFLDFIIPDYTIFSPIRKILFSTFTISKIWKFTRIRKWQYITNIKKIKIWNNCFINRWNLFDNNSLISIWNDCSIGYNNKFITSWHYEKQNIQKDNLQFSTYSEKIIIWNNVWITTNCIILPWTKVNDNVIIAAWAIVKWELEANYIYWWIPAKKIRKTEGFISKIN